MTPTRPAACPSITLSLSRRDGERDAIPGSPLAGRFVIAGLTGEIRPVLQPSVLGPVVILPFTMAHVTALEIGEF